MQLSGALFPLLAGLATASGLLPRLAANASIPTTSGPVIGHVVNNVNEFLGIRYAQAPTGPLRFEPPQRFNGTAPIIAQNFVSLSKQAHPARISQKNGMIKYV